VRVCVLGDHGGLGSRIASEFNVGAIGLDGQPPDECDGIVLVVGADPAPSSRPLIDTTEAGWRDVAEGAPLRAMRALQRARRVTLAECGNIVVIAPSVGLIGAGGLSPYAAGIEAIRAMAKSAARQWAADRISVSLIVVPPKPVMNPTSALAADEKMAAIAIAAAIRDATRTNNGPTSSSTSPRGLEGRPPTP
jgi:3-oxoacyl-[acyl-carrier protein] reductase